MYSIIVDASFYHGEDILRRELTKLESDGEIYTHRTVLSII